MSAVEVVASEQVIAPEQVIVPEQVIAPKRASANRKFVTSSQSINIVDPLVKIVDPVVKAVPKSRNVGPTDPKTGKPMTSKEMANAIIAAEDKQAEATRFTEHIIQNTVGATLQSSRLGNVRKALKELNASQEIIDSMKVPEITIEANDKASNKSANRIVKRLQTEITGVDTSLDDDDTQDEPVSIPDYFSLQNVYDRLIAYDTTQHPTLGAVVDVMILWNTRPAEIMTLSVTDDSMATGYVKAENLPRLTITFLPLQQAKKYLNWIQSFKETLPSPTKDGKKYRQFLEQFPGLKIKTLRVIGAEYAAYCNTSNPDHTTDKELMALRRIALRHLPQQSSAEYYSVIIKTIPGEYKLKIAEQ
jgi:hypothetical protein